MIFMKPFVVFIFGPPGSGKSTQADFLAAATRAFHLNTGKLLWEIIYNSPRYAEDKIVAEVKKTYEAGAIVDPRFVARMVLEKTEELYAGGKSIVFSGSPRTLLEAELLLPQLRRFYGERVFLVELQIKAETTIARNGRRQVCSLCGQVAPWDKNGAEPIKCVCGGDLVKRPDDEPEVIKKRLAAYHKQTQPVIAYLKSVQVPVISVDGEPEPQAVFNAIMRSLGVLLG